LVHTYAKAHVLATRITHRRIVYSISPNNATCTAATMGSSHRGASSADAELITMT
jgi:hypothetical protein